MLGRPLSQCAAFSRYSCQGCGRTILGMSRKRPECSDSDPLDRSVAADLLLRQEPDDEEKEDEDDGKEDDDDDDETNDGY